MPGDLFGCAVAHDLKVVVEGDTWAAFQAEQPGSGRLQAVSLQSLSRRGGRCKDWVVLMLAHEIKADKQAAQSRDVQLVYLKDNCP